MSAQERLLHWVHESFNNVNSCDTSLNHRKACRLQRSKLGRDQGISDRHQAVKLNLGERLAGITLLAHDLARAKDNH